MLVYRAAIFVAVVAAVGCSRTWVKFKPYSAAAPRAPAVMGYAIVTYEGDIPALAQAEGYTIGSLEVDGNGFANSEDVRLRATVEAAEYGGTHVVVANEGSSTSWAQISPDRATTTFQGNTATTTLQPGTRMRVVRPHGAFIVVRVPPHRWLDLPATIRPILGTHFKGEYPRRLSVSGPPGAGMAPPTAVQSTSTFAWSCGAAADQHGMCFRTVDMCNDFQARLGKQHVMCVGRREAHCFSYAKEGRTLLSCHPTIEACRAFRDYAFTNGGAIVQECTLSR